MKNPFISPTRKRLNNSSSKDWILGNSGKTPKLFLLERLDSRKFRKNA